MFMHKVRRGILDPREGIPNLVKETFTCWRAAETGDTVQAADFALELVVVGEFFVWFVLANVLVEVA